MDNLSLQNTSNPALKATMVMSNMEANIQTPSDDDTSFKQVLSRQMSTEAANTNTTNVPQKQNNTPPVNTSQAANNNSTQDEAPNTNSSESVTVKPNAENVDIPIANTKGMSKKQAAPATAEKDAKRLDSTSQNFDSSGNTAALNRLLAAGAVLPDSPSANTATANASSDDKTTVDAPATDSSGNTVALNMLLAAGAVLPVSLSSHTVPVSSDNKTTVDAAATDSRLLASKLLGDRNTVSVNVKNGEVSDTGTSSKTLPNNSKQTATDENTDSKTTDFKAIDLTARDGKLTASSTAADLKNISADKLMTASLNQITKNSTGESDIPTSLSKTVKTADIPTVAYGTPVEPVKLQQAASAIATQNTIAATPGKDGWDKAISQKIVWMVGNSEQSASLTLNPPDLGPLQVVIHVHNGQTDTTFSSANQEVRQALQDGMANLRDMMKDAGVTLGQANINDGGRQAQNFQQSSESGSRSRSADNISSVDSLDTSRSILTKVRVSNGLVDTFA